MPTGRRDSSKLGQITWTVALLLRALLTPSCARVRARNLVRSVPWGYTSVHIQNKGKVAMAFTPSSEELRSMMAGKETADLWSIVTSHRSEYTPQAIVAAIGELERRDPSLREGATFEGVAPPSRRLPWGYVASSEQWRWWHEWEWMKQREAIRAATRAGQHPSAVDSADTFGTARRIYYLGVVVSFCPIFIGCWIFCIAHYGFLLGVGLGWLPSGIVALFAAFLWPLGAVLLVVLFGWLGAR